MSTTRYEPAKPLRLAVLISGGGRTMVNLARRIMDGRLNARIEVVLSSRADAKGLEHADDLGIDTAVVSRRLNADVETFSRQIFEHVERSEADLVCLAGFMNLLRIEKAFKHKVINIHPALLPGFGGKGMYGHHVHEAVLAAGCRVSGCTVHFADASYDTGPIIVQRSCPVRPNDTPDRLAARVFREECIAYPQAVSLIAAGRVKVENGVARILPAPGA
ncbi:MAG: phosphoribosylglycinamide formyltransferase [Phycisphaeraceae bacterium]|nr:phosphoribosylglycinamide formyltransferase [Phycisphaeraceae bacterium]